MMGHKNNNFYLACIDVSTSNPDGNSWATYGAEYVSISLSADGTQLWATSDAANVWFRSDFSITNPGMRHSTYQSKWEVSKERTYRLNERTGTENAVFPFRILWHPNIHTYNS